MDMRARHLSAGCLAVVLLTITGCSSATSSPASPSPSAAITHFHGYPATVSFGPGPTGDVVVWDGPRELAVVTWGSSGCPMLPLRVQVAPGNTVTMTLGRTVPSGSLCINDMAATTSLVPLPAGINSSKPVVVTVSGDNQRTTVTLPAQGNP